MFMTVKEASEKWGISDRRIRALCVQGKILGAVQEEGRWKIPTDAVKPADGRYKSNKSLFDVIDNKKAQLKNKRTLTEGERDRFVEEFSVEYTYNSNAIEGNLLTLRETDMVLKGLIVENKPLKDHLEAVGHNDAFELVRELAKENVPLSESVIKKIHFLVLADKRNDRGVYRRVPIKLLGAKYMPVQPYLIQPKIEQILAEYEESNEHIITRLARFHICFEDIHPFIDGNGRTGRLITNLELMKAGFPPIDIKFTERMAYYKAFDDYYATQSTIAMEKLFADYINQGLDMYLDILD